jgi:hypothetical protein
VTAGSDDFDAFLEQYHQRLEPIVNGDSEPFKAMWSNRDDVTLANPWGPTVRGWEQAAARMDFAASNFRDGKVLGFETLAKHLGEDLVCTVEVERFEVKIGAQPDPTLFTLRVTSIFLK